MSEYKSAKEIIEERDAYQYEKARYEEAIEGLKEKKQVSLNRRNKKYFNDLISEHKITIHEIQDCIEVRNQLLEQLSGFNSEEFIEFLTECISIKEGKEFVNTRVVLNFSMNMEELYIPSFVNYFLIFDKELEKEEQRLENTFIASHLLMFYEDMLNESKRVWAPLTADLSLLSNGMLNTSFKQFPYLEEVAYNLVDRRLREPNKSSKEILADELECVKEMGVKLKKD